MNPMEIERKFLIRNMPNLSDYPSKKLVQGYLCTNPTVRVRSENDEYYLTYKSKSKDFISREEYNLPLNKEAFEHMLTKVDGNIISKTRYYIPLGKNKEGNELVAEVDVFDPPFAPLIFAEVEFPTIEEANSFVKPDWLGDDVTEDRAYYNSEMSKKVFRCK